MVHFACGLDSRKFWESEDVCVDIREQGPRVSGDDDGAVETWEGIVD